MFDQVDVHWSDEFDLSDLESDAGFTPYPIGTTFNGLNLSVRYDGTRYVIRYRNCLIHTKPLHSTYEAIILYGLPDGYPFQTQSSDDSELQESIRRESQRSIKREFHSLGRASFWIDMMLEGEGPCRCCGRALLC